MSLIRRVFGLVQRKDQAQVDLNTDRVIAYADRYAEGLAAFRDGEDDTDEPETARAST